ncbi:MAG: geranylgeranylglycerol-phosphate geranylgeranyltransferase [Saprospiraceae bacterium]|nr:geranylgeranylglycerol-phosphate geranylgeranyltransferase [Saprospiraceae bacterium]
MFDYVKILRPLNLIIIASTQVLMYFLIVIPFIKSNNLPPLLDQFQIILFIMVTVLIAAGGNIINDIFDVELDLINKPEHTYVGYTISRKGAWILYAFLTAVGGIITIYLGYLVEKQSLMWIYPLAVILLFFYSSHLKYTFLIGNIIVAFFTAFVIWILLLSHDALLLQPHHPSVKLLIAFGSFSFLANLMREIVKDLEDKEGDLQVGAKTLGVSMPLKNVKNYIFSIAFLLFSGLIWSSQFYMPELYDFRTSIFIWVFLIAPLVLMMLKLSKASDKKGFGAVSRFLKMYMLAGLILCILLSENIANAAQ